MKKNNKKTKIPTYVNKEEVDSIMKKIELFKSSEEKTNVANVYKNEMPAITESIKSKLENNKDITQLFPDIELAIQIMTSSILAPNDMMTTNLIYRQPDIKIPGEVNNYILETIKTYIKENYNLTSNLNTIVRESLFMKGAYAEAIIPTADIERIHSMSDNGEVSLESIIDSTIKDYDSTYVLDTESITMNDKKIDTNELLNLSITDDIGILGAKDKYLLSIESMDNKKLSNENLLDSVFSTKSSNNGITIKQKNSEIKENPLIEITGNIDDSINKPLVMKLPVESIIPVHASGDTSQHLGYFVLLDNNGVPVKITTQDGSMMKDINSMAKSQDNKINIINKTKKALYGITKDDPKVSNLEEMYGAIITAKIKTALKNGKYGDLVDINKNSDIYRIILHKSLKDQKTKLLYIPIENMSYYAFEYRDNGTGKSLLEKVSVLFSVRSILLFARLMANVKNSVSTTEVTSTLSEHDTDPEKTMEYVISEAMKTRQTMLPLGVTKIDDLVDWSHKVGFKFNFKGPGLPDMDISTSDENTSKVIPDTDLDEMIQEHIIMSFGLTMEMVKAGYDSEFATTVLSNNILLAKRVIQLQDKLTPQITSHIIKLIKNDPIIINKIKAIINNNLPNIKKLINKDFKKEHGKKLSDSDIVEYILAKYTTNISVDLPKPAVQETENLKDAFEKYVGVLDDYLELMISEDALPEDFSGDMSAKMDDIKTVIKTVLVRKWMAENDYMPEVNEFLTLDDEGKPELDLFNLYNDYVESLSKAIIPFMKENTKLVNKTNNKLDNIDEDDDNGGDDNSGSDTTSDENSDTDF